MNIRTRKSNHRAVNIKSDSDETGNDLDYFIPLLKEKKTTIRTSAINNIIDICTTQNRREQVHELDVDLANALCNIVVSGNKEQSEVISALHAIELVAIMDGLNRHEMYKTIKGALSSLIDKGEDQINPTIIAQALEAISVSCFINCSMSDSYENTIEMFKEIILTEKNKPILNSALKGWLLMLTRLEKQKINNHLDLLDRITKLSESSYHELRISSAIAIAFLVSEMDAARLEEEEEKDEGEEEDYEEEDYEDEDYDYSQKSKSNGHHAKAQEEAGSNDEEDDEEYDEDEDYSDEEPENEIVNLVENLVLSSTEKGKKKLQANALLRKIIKTLKDGVTPTEFLKVDQQFFYFEGWRKYIQLHEIKRILKSGASIQWGYNKDLRDLFGIEIRSVHENSMFVREQRQFFSPNSVKSKQRTQDLTRDRRMASNVYAYHHDEE